MDGCDLAGIMISVVGVIRVFLSRRVASPAWTSDLSKCERSRGHLRGFSTKLSPEFPEKRSWVVLALPPGVSLLDDATATNTETVRTIRKLEHTTTLQCRMNAKLSQGRLCHENHQGHFNDAPRPTTYVRVSNQVPLHNETG